MSSVAFLEGFLSARALEIAVLAIRAVVLVAGAVVAAVTLAIVLAIAVSITATAMVTIVVTCSSSAR
jgi:hypothetical protein